VEKYRNPQATEGESIFIQYIYDCNLQFPTYCNYQ